ncbi:MAG: hypothetical protein LBL61_06590 [Elusimicrobiota bacterium]|jgi:hypothetical protein|nr:hypothetical protein [Elusimicrobiota bacterium]
MKRLIISLTLLISAVFAFAQQFPAGSASAAEDFKNQLRAKLKENSFKPGRPYDQKRINALARLDYHQLGKIIKAEEQDYYDYLVGNMKEKGYFDYEKLKEHDALSPMTEDDPEDFSGMNLTAIYNFIKKAPKIPAGRNFDYGAIMPADAKVFLLGEVHQQDAWRPAARLMNSLNKKFGTRVAALENVVEGAEDYAEMLSDMSDAQLEKIHNKNIKKKKLVRAIASVYANLFGQIKGLDIIGLDSIRYALGGLEIGSDVKFSKKLLLSIVELMTDNHNNYIYYAARNTVWIDKILPFLKAGQTVMVYGGAAHTSYTPKDYSMADYFVKTAYKPVSVFFINSNNFTSYGRQVFDFSKAYEYLIEVPAEKRAQLGADYFIVYSGPWGVPSCLHESQVCRPDMDSDWVPIAEPPAKTPNPEKN